MNPIQWVHWAGAFSGIFRHLSVGLDIFLFPSRKSRLLFTFSMICIFCDFLYFHGNNQIIESYCQEWANPILFLFRFRSLVIASFYYFGKPNVLKCELVEIDLRQLSIFRMAISSDFSIGKWQQTIDGHRLEFDHFVINFPSFSPRLNWPKWIWGESEQLANRGKSIKTIAPSPSILSWQWSADGWSGKSVLERGRGNCNDETRARD